MPIVPFKLNQDRRHHIPRQRHKVTNWPAYDASLRQRGSLTVWVSDEAIAAWASVVHGSALKFWKVLERFELFSITVSQA